MSVDGAATYFVFLQHHKVEMLDPFFGILTHALHKGWVTNDITDILINEGVPGRNVRASHTTKGTA